MTDRELLEKAAKAAGLAVAGLADKMLVYPEHWAGGLIVETPTGGHKAWNPLTDDGDALRLAVKLKICLEFDYCEDDAPVVYVGQAHERRGWPRYENFPDPHAATRRAIVRAAAAIYDSQQEQGE